MYLISVIVFYQKHYHSHNILKDFLLNDFQLYFDFFRKKMFMINGLCINYFLMLIVICKIPFIRYSLNYSLLVKFIYLNFVNFKK